MFPGVRQVTVGAGTSLDNAGSTAKRDFTRMAAPILDRRSCFCGPVAAGYYESMRRQGRVAAEIPGNGLSDAGIRRVGGPVVRRAPTSVLVADSDVGAAGGVRSAIFGGDADRPPAVYPRSAENVARGRPPARKTTARRRPAAAKPGEFTFWKPGRRRPSSVRLFGGAAVFASSAGKDLATEGGRVEIFERSPRWRRRGRERETTEAMSAG